jgi:tRNA(Ile2) C34 agmatinyltransferase TiaS
MIRKVYEVDPMVCPKCDGRMKVSAFITDYRGPPFLITQPC